MFNDCSNYIQAKVLLLLMFWVVNINVKRAQKLF